MPTIEQMQESYASFLKMKRSLGTLSFNDARGLWFYSIPGKWGRAKIGSGATPEQAIEDACKQ